MVKRRSNPRIFFTKEEKSRIVQAIREAEKKTSGEIRVSLERRLKGELMAQAKRVFERFGMTRTEKRNGVLIYLALTSHEFAILGDRGIHEKVGEDFWKDIASGVQNEFSQGKFVEGLVSGVQQIGEKLKAFFPREAGDVNELPDQIR